jgi:uncharacterized OB-fold protein
VASWVEQLDAKIEAAKRPPRRKRGGTTEEGQTCPRCGDLFSWRALYCPSCRMPLK